MTSSKERLLTREIRHALEFCTGVWVELGVSGWERTHQRWMIDAENLIVWTSRISIYDPRLRDEALDWCIHNWKHISQVRLRNIVSTQSLEDVEKWASFAGTVNKHASISWPFAGESISYNVTGKSRLRPFSEPSLLALRMRANFGISARTEVLQHFFLQPERSLTAAMLSQATNYAKRNVSEACEAMVAGGILSSTLSGNRFYYRLTSSEFLQAIAGELPQIRPNWNALVKILDGLVGISQKESESSQGAFIVQIHDLFDDLVSYIDVLGLERPTWARGGVMVSNFREWSDSLMSAISVGQWPPSSRPSVKFQ